MSRRRGKHEEHVNHESWAIPYGDLVTLLLAFFVVMYAISSVNEGKYRVVSESLNAAFRGAPTAPTPIQVGERSATSLVAPVVQIESDISPDLLALRRMAEQLQEAMYPLISQGLVDVHQGDGYIEVAIRSDILFASGAAQLSPTAQPIIRLLGEALGGFPNSIRVEGHTDNVPIRTAQFRSNWELSAGRAANVVHLLTESGVDPRRLSVLAFGEFRPVLPNATADGRNANRRVVLTVVGTEPLAAPDVIPAEGGEVPPIPAGAS